MLILQKLYSAKLQTFASFIFKTVLNLIKGKHATHILKLVDKIRVHLSFQTTLVFVLMMCCP